MHNEAELAAREFYGFGKWELPYWFIGPEQGGSNNEQRAAAFKQLGIDGLCDCREFHNQIQETRWHREPPNTAALQPTWRRLMLALMPSIGRPSEKIGLKHYQACHWGNRNSGETCVIELSGLSAKNFKESIDTSSFKASRIERIKERLKQAAPQFVVMYGVACEKDWKEISGCNLVRCDVVKSGSTLFAFMPHPTSHGQRDSEWIELGAKLARH
jgi:hypothetical protein